MAYTIDDLARDLVQKMNRPKATSTAEPPAPAEPRAHGEALSERNLQALLERLDALN